MTPDLSRLLAALKRPAAYPEPTPRVQVIQTQMSVVFLTPDYAYKLKKPVNLGYVDYTKLERRQYYCAREVELNRRLCAEGYLGVVPVTLQGEEIKFGGAGEVIDYAVKMRRLPDDKLLDHLLEEDQATPQMLEAVARKVAEFHREAATSPEIASFGTLEAVKRNTEENFAQTEKYFGSCLTETQFNRIRGYTRRFEDEQAPLFARRVEEGRTRDCHGDLHAQHICFCLGLCIFDCIEFNDRFRYGDVAGEAAFLAMDLDHYGRADLGWAFVNAYVEASQDNELKELLSFYKCYRAYVRGKVACFKTDDPYVSQPERDASRARAQSYFDLALSYTRPRPLLLLTMGLVGSGKTTLANELTKRLGLVHLSSDVVRKTLAGIPITEHRYEEADAGIYSPEFTRRTYASLTQQAEGYLRQGASVILDAAFLKRAERLAALQLAEKLGADAYVLECRLAPELTRARLEQRRHERSASDGRWEIYLRQQEWREPVTELPPAKHLLIDTARLLEENVGQILEAVV